MIEAHFLDRDDAIVGRHGQIKLHGPEGFAGMRAAGRLAAEILDALAEHVAPGVTTQQLDDVVHRMTLDAGAVPATLGYRGYTKSCCTSINHVVCHGIPGDRVLKDGDIVNIDHTVLLDVGANVGHYTLRLSELVGEHGRVIAVEPVPETALIGDRNGMAYSGTLVTYGIGTGVVVATGDATEIGRISALLARVQSLTTPLLRKIGEFGSRLSIAIITGSVGVFFFGILFREYRISDMFLSSVGLAVAAIPEGLPAIVTAVLSLGVQRMARRNAIVKRLPAVETLGSTSAICSDKTGTLTRNEMTVQALWTPAGAWRLTGIGYAPEGALQSTDGTPVAGVPEPVGEIVRAGALLFGIGMQIGGSQLPC